MALADLMKKGFLSSATATFATPATHEIFSIHTVAKVADAAVANPSLVKSKFDEQRHIPTISESLALFRFDLVKQEIAEGYPEAEMRRFHNLAHVLMRDENLPFEDAVKVAAQIVIHCPMAECELTYVDLIELWSEIDSR